MTLKRTSHTELIRAVSRQNGGKVVGITLRGGARIQKMSKCPNINLKRD